MAWNSKQYARFKGQRLEPALDLIAAIPPIKARRVVDLGCGNGAVLAFLIDRFPEAEILAVDRSEDMLKDIQTDGRWLTTQQVDIDTWTPEVSPDLIYSNAALHWCDDHPALFQRLYKSLAPGGVLAVQMPNNWHQPSHQIMHELATSKPWDEYLSAHVRPSPVLKGHEYREMFLSFGASISTFDKIYDHVLEGENPVAEWLKGSSLGVLMAHLPDSLKTDFYQAYCQLAIEAYPPNGRGQTHFPFHRTFILAQKRVD